MTTKMEQLMEMKKDEVQDIRFRQKMEELYLECFKLISLLRDAKDDRLKCLIAKKMKSNIMEQQLTLEEMAKDGVIEEDMLLRTGKENMFVHNALDLIA